MAWAESLQLPIVSTTGRGKRKLTDTELRCDAHSLIRVARSGISVDSGGKPDLSVEDPLTAWGGLPERRHCALNYLPPIEFEDLHSIHIHQAALL